MFRNSILYRRLWYIKKRNAKRLHVYSRIITILIILALLFSYAQKRLIPYLIEISEYKSQAQITDIINNAISSNLAENIGDGDLVLIDRDESGRIISIKTNTIKLNKLSTEISNEIQKGLSSLEEQNIAVPIGALLGSSLLASVGLNIHIKTIPQGDVKVELKSEFIEAGINQTKHLISLQVRTRVGIVAPLIKKKTELNTNIPVAETVIVGDIPDLSLNE